MNYFELSTLRQYWLPLVDIFRTFYFKETNVLEDKLDRINTIFVFS